MTEDGFVPVLKVPGPTSHDIVDRVRRQLSVRCGHLGTLDPAASGVLVLALGRATRLAAYLKDQPKTYRAIVRLGLRTDTGDLTGRPLEERRADGTAAQDAAQALAGLVGRRRHRPPASSAVKVGGEPLYKAFRRGEAPVAPLREIEVRNALLVAFEGGPYALATVDLEVSSGTYIRTLAEEFGAALGLPATLEALLRVQVGPFGIDDAVTVEEASSGAGRLPAGFPFRQGPRVVLDREGLENCRHGRPIRVLAALPEGTLPAFFEGSLVAMGLKEGESWRPVTVLWP